MARPRSVKDLDYYLKLPYGLEIRRVEGGFFARIEELPGCISQGETREEALEMIEDAMRAWIADALEAGHPIPEPVSSREYSGELRVRLPKSLHRMAARKAQEDGVSLNQYVAVAVARAVGE